MLRIFYNNFKHFFCEKCLAQWLIVRSVNCPMCRTEVKISEDNEISADRWSIISSSEAKCEEALLILDGIFVNAIKMMIK